MAHSCHSLAARKSEHLGRAVDASNRPDSSSIELAGAELARHVSKKNFCGKSFSAPCSKKENLFNIYVLLQILKGFAILALSACWPVGPTAWQLC